MKSRGKFYRWGMVLNYKEIYGGLLCWYERLALRLWHRLYGPVLPGFTVKGTRTGRFSSTTKNFCAQSEAAEREIDAFVERVLKEHPGARFHHDEVIIPPGERHVHHR